MLHIYYILLLLLFHFIFQITLENGRKQKAKQKEKLFFSVEYFYTKTIQIGAVATNSFPYSNKFT